VAEHANVVRITRFRPAAGKRDELLQRLENGAQQMRDMEGCFGSQVCESREFPDEIVAISRWASQSAVDQFLRGTAAQRSEVAQLAAGPPTSEHLTSL
jgi:quinol monooxygenase YgiN